VDPCPFCSEPADRIWINSEHAIALAAEEPAAEGHIVVVPKGCVRRRMLGDSEIFARAAKDPSPEVKAAALGGYGMPRFEIDGDGLRASFRPARRMASASPAETWPIRFLDLRPSHQQAFHTENEPASAGRSR
jgi:hypothetical protein